jgi:hypothetical protein
VVHSTEALAYWQRKDELMEEAISTINWEAIGTAMKDEIWDKALQDLEHWLNAKQTDPDLQHLLLIHLRGWQENQPTHSSHPFAFNELLRSQANIGWNRFFEGWLAKEWLVLQQAYYTSIRSHRSGKCRTVALITKLWNIAWDMWEHRNGILHNKDNAATEREKRAINKAVIEVFNKLQSMMLSPQDRHLTTLWLG